MILLIDCFIITCVLYRLYSFWNKKSLKIPKG